MCGVSIVVFVLLNTVSSNILADSVTATGFGIAFYYGLTGLACPWFFRHELFKSARNSFLVGLLPLLGGIILLAILGDSGYQAWSPANSATGSSWLGISPPLAMALLGLVIGVVIMIAQRIVVPGALLPLEDRGRRPRRAGGPQLARTIVLGYDGSDGAEFALDKAVELAKLEDARIVVVFAYEIPAAYGGETGDYRRAVRDLAEHATAKAVPRLEQAGVEYTIELVPERPVDGLVTIADRPAPA